MQQITQSAKLIFGRRRPTLVVQNDLAWYSLPLVTEPSHQFASYRTMPPWCSHRLWSCHACAHTASPHADVSTTQTLLPHSRRIGLFPQKVCVEQQIPKWSRSERASRPNLLSSRRRTRTGVTSRGVSSQKGRRCLWCSINDRTMQRRRLDPRRARALRLTACHSPRVAPQGGCDKASEHRQAQGPCCVEVRPRCEDRGCRQG